MRKVRAARFFKSNAHLIAEVARLGYIHQQDVVLDPTYGHGSWWKEFRPDFLVTHHRPSDGTDFRNLHWSDALFDVAAYDPPYVAPGGRRTSTIPDMNEAYGMDEAPRTPELCQELINTGLVEMHRLVVPKGIVLVKCKNYVSSGRLFLGAHFTLAKALELEFKVEEIFQYITRKGGPQPARKKQVHAVNNYSTLFVLRKGRRA